MKILHVGGKHFFNRFSNLEAAIERAGHDDVIELHKDVHDAAFYISKNITIIGHGHLITPKDGKAALDCASYVTLDHIRFVCKPRTNAVIIRNGGRLSHIDTHIAGPARALYPTIIQRGGTLSIEDGNIMYMETYQGHGSTRTVTFLKNCRLMDYYRGFAYIDNGDYALSKFRGSTSISESVIECTLLDGRCKLSDTALLNFNKAVGKVEMHSCKLMTQKVSMISYPNEPKDGPLKDWKPDIAPYALHIASGKVMAENLSSNIAPGCFGFYMTNGSLSINDTRIIGSKARHLVRGGSILFNNVMDDSFYEIKKAQCSKINSRVNMSSKTKSAMDQLDVMIGLGLVKRQLRTIMNTISVNMKYPEKDFGFSHHMIFAGDPGTGKTTVAKLAAQALFEIGAIPENKCMEVPASQLIKGFVGQTGEHVESVMKKALGGVLFIDEAYELMVKDNQNTFNNDALAVLLRYMEDHRHDLVVIAAGYEKEMKEFLASNVGLTRRFQWVSFEDYTPEQMADMFLLMSRQYKEGFAFRNPRTVLIKHFEELTGFYRTHPDAKGRTTNGGNGGLVRNLFQQTAFARNNRVADDPDTVMEFIMNDIAEAGREEMKKALNVNYGITSMCN